MILIYIKYFRLFSKDFFGFFRMIFMTWLSWFSLQNMMKCIEVPKTSSIISIRLRRWRPWNPSLAWVFWRCLSGWSSCIKHQSYKAGRVGGSYWHIAVWCVYETCVAKHEKRSHLLAITSGGKEILELFAITIPNCANSSLCISNAPKKTGKSGISQRRE